MVSTGKLCKVVFREQTHNARRAEHHCLEAFLLLCGHYCVLNE